MAKENIVAVYERESTLWKNAHIFYVAQDWTRMECRVVDYTQEIESCRSGMYRWVDADGDDVTEQQIERLYSKPYHVVLINKRKTNSRCYKFKTKDEANACVQWILNDRILKNFKRTK